MMDSAVQDRSFLSPSRHKRGRIVLQRTKSQLASLAILFFLVMFHLAADSFLIPQRPQRALARRTLHRHSLNQPAESPSPTSNRRQTQSSHGDDQYSDDDDDEEGDGASFSSKVLQFDDFGDEPLTASELKMLTVPQLKQQLRLRGLRVSGNKQELTDRLLRLGRAFDDELRQRGPVGEDRREESASSGPDVSILNEDVAREMKSRRSKARKEAQEKGKEFIDVTAFLDEEDKTKDVKSSLPRKLADSNSDDEGNKPSSNPEVWGADAKIVSDYEGRSPVVDGLSRTVVEFKGSNQTTVQAFVVASRDAMKPFLEGGKDRNITNAADPEARIREIQLKRENEEKRPVRFEDSQGLDEGDEIGNYENILHRDFSDWGKYTVTGAQLSAQEVQGVLILTDVYGPFTEATKALAEKIAFECQPVVCMVPDLFRGKPWKEDVTTPGFNEEGQDYEEWRATHSDLRVSIDIRAAAAVLRQQYGVSSIAVWGMCYGGGRALEAAAGYLPDGKIHDVNGAIGPVPVDPDVAVAWYPTRYNARDLFGSGRSQILDLVSEKKRAFAVMAVFAGKDKLAGATKEDAAELKSLLGEDDRIKDFMVKVFPDQDHAFAHHAFGRNYDESELDRFVDDEFGGAGRLSIDDGDAEVACLLSTAFMETYSRKFLPTAGLPVMNDESASAWTENLEMKDFRTARRRDVRQEIEESLESFVEEPLHVGRLFDPAEESQGDELLQALRAMQPEGIPDALKIQDGDNLETVYAKLTAADDKFELF